MRVFETCRRLWSRRCRSEKGERVDVLFVGVRFLTTYGVPSDRYSLVWTPYSWVQGPCSKVVNSSLKTLDSWIYQFFVLYPSCEDPSLGTSLPISPLTDFVLHVPVQVNRVQIPRRNVL